MPKRLTHTKQVDVAALIETKVEKNGASRAVRRERRASLKVEVTEEYEYHSDRTTPPIVVEFVDSKPKALPPPNESSIIDAP